MKLPQYTKTMSLKEVSVQLKRKSITFHFLLDCLLHVIQSLYLPGLLNKNFKSCGKTFDITEFSLTAFQQLATFVSGGALSPCFGLLKIIKVMTLVCLTATQGPWKGHLFLLVLLFLSVGLADIKKEMLPHWASKLKAKSLWKFFLIPRR